jgi:signal-induced proliferation-associated 1 like protein 3
MPVRLLIPTPVRPLIPMPDPLIPMPDPLIPMPDPLIPTPVLPATPVPESS